MTEPQPTKPPKLPARRRAQELAEARLSVFEREGSYDTLCCEGQRVPLDERLDWTLTTFLDCGLNGLNLGQVALDHARMTNTDVESCGMVKLSLVGASVFSCSFASSRLGSLDAMDGVFKAVEFVGCRIGYLNLRAASWQDVRFTDCRIEEFDAVDAELKRLALPGTTIDSINLQHARLTDVDLRGATLSSIKGVEHLAGVTMTLDQIADLAPAIAASIGIRLT